MKKSQSLAPAKATNATQIYQPDPFRTWFPVHGESMTNANKEYQIPDGSMVLCKEIFPKHILGIPVHRPVVIIGTTGIDTFAIVKTVTFLNGVDGTIRLTSYNPNVADYWMQLPWIKRFFEVLEIERPNGEIIEVLPYTGSDL